MKPERIQSTDKLSNNVWGIYQTFKFKTPEQVDNFTKYLLDMADNYKRNAACKRDESYTQVTLLVPVYGEADFAAVQTFIGNAKTAYTILNPPVEEPTPAYDPKPALLN